MAGWRGKLNLGRLPAPTQATQEEGIAVRAEMKQGQALWKEANTRRPPGSQEAPLLTWVSSSCDSTLWCLTPGLCSCDFILRKDVLSGHGTDSDLTPGSEAPGLHTSHQFGVLTWMQLASTGPHVPLG